MTSDFFIVNKDMFQQTRKIIITILVVSFIGSSIQAPVYAQVDPMPFMPKPGVMVHLSSEFSSAYLKGIVVHPEDPFKFDFIIYKGDKPLTEAQQKEEYTKLTKYFLASLAVPDDDQWVNLSPYEKDRIIKDDFGKTEMGRDLLAQDYMLKQMTASLIYPEDRLGKKFWDTVYAKAQQQYGTTNIPVNTFNKVWILPDSALIYEKGNTAYVIKDHLKVMLEEDYLSLQKHSGIQSAPVNRTHTIASQIVKEIVLPELQREVNEDKNFAPLRQVYSGMLLATWFKHELKKSVLDKVYANKGKVKGVDQNPKTNDEIYRQYLRAYKKGVFNYIKEDVDRYTNEVIPRKYFSGGAVDWNMKDVEITTNSGVGTQAMVSTMNKLVVASFAMNAARPNTGISMRDRLKFFGKAAGIAAVSAYLPSISAQPQQDAVRFPASFDEADDILTGINTGRNNSDRGILEAYYDIAGSDFLAPVKERKDRLLRKYVSAIAYFLQQYGVTTEAEFPVWLQSLQKGSEVVPYALYSKGRPVIASYSGDFEHDPKGIKTGRISLSSNEIAKSRSLYGIDSYEMRLVVSNFLFIIAHEVAHVEVGSDDNMDELMANLGAFAVLKDTFYDTGIETNRLMVKFPQVKTEEYEALRQSGGSSVQAVNRYWIGKLKSDFENPSKGSYINWSLMYKLALSLIRSKATTDGWQFIELLEAAYKKANAAMTSKKKLVVGRSGSQLNRRWVIGGAIGVGLLAAVGEWELSNKREASVDTNIPALVQSNSATPEEINTLNIANDLIRLLDESAKVDTRYHATVYFEGNNWTDAEINRINGMFLWLDKQVPERMRAFAEYMQRNAATQEIVFYKGDVQELFRQTYPIVPSQAKLGAEDALTIVYSLKATPNKITRAIWFSPELFDANNIARFVVAFMHEVLGIQVAMNPLLDGTHAPILTLEEHRANEREAYDFNIPELNKITNDPKYIQTYPDLTNALKKLIPIEEAKRETWGPSQAMVATQVPKSTKLPIVKKRIDGDRATLAPDLTRGGIDLNSANLAMMIKRDGKGVVLPLAQQDLAQLSKAVGDGLEPKILSIIPASQSPVFAQLQTSP